MYPDNNDRFRLRRRMTRVSFWTLILTMPTVLAMAYFGDETVGDNLLACSSIVAPIIAACIAQVLHYQHIVTKFDLETFYATQPKQAGRFASNYNDTGGYGGQYSVLQGGPGYQDFRTGPLTASHPGFGPGGPGAGDHSA